MAAVTLVDGIHATVISCRDNNVQLESQKVYDWHDTQNT